MLRLMNRINEFGLFKLSRVLNWSDEIKFVEEEEKRVKIIEEFQAVFSETLGKSSNGAAENAVCTFKKKLKALVKSEYDQDEALVRYLFYSRATPHVTTAVSPAELQIGRKFRTRLDLIRPMLRYDIECKKLAQQRTAPGSRVIQFANGTKVMAKDYRSNSWELATIIEQLSPVAYLVETTNNQL
ncbi:uncharacterized protein LOC103568661 isoform X2 [Microplitis demolitor]|uniref:uncharacterized protein LOC103568661 isoform X2 n=1 Tax=Microplitis demolitor TaxID=69319 RepID=UPI0004CD1A83|nr:uncharacterized protein LOC103568661 isoform X2 [Microplitis demolitor]